MTRRFLNLCIKHDIIVWNIQFIARDQITFELNAKDFKSLKSLRKKTGTHLKIIHKNGCFFQWMKYRKHFIFPLAFLIFFLLMLSLHQYIWRIEVNGNIKISNQTLITYLNRKHLGYGSNKKDIHLEDISLSLRQDFNDIIWANAYVKGTTLFLDIDELKHMEKASREDSKTGSLVAAKDCVISSILTREGTPKAIKGDTVKKGDILIDGAIPILDDANEIVDYRYTKADGDIYGYVEYPYFDEIPFSIFIDQTTEENYKIPFFIVLNQKLLLGYHPAYAQYVTVEEEKQLHLGDSFYLPVYYGMTHYYEKKTLCHDNDIQLIKTLATMHLKDFVEKMGKNGVSIIDKNVIMVKAEKSYQIKGTIVSCEPVGIYAPVEISYEKEKGNPSNEHE